MRTLHPAVGEDEPTPRRGVRRKLKLIPGVEQSGDGHRHRRRFAPLSPAQERIRLRFGLTTMEWQVAMMWLTGDAGAKTAAKAFDLSARTVEIHNSRAIAKIKAASKINQPVTKLQAALILDRALRPTQAPDRQEAE